MQAGYLLHPKKSRPLYLPRLAVFRSIVDPHTGHDGVLDCVIIYTRIRAAQLYPISAATVLPETPAAPHHLSPFQTATIPPTMPNSPNTAGARNTDQTAHKRLACAHLLPDLPGRTLAPTALFSIGTGPVQELDIPQRALPIQDHFNDFAASTVGGFQ